MSKASISDPSQVVPGNIAVMKAGTTGHVAVVLNSTLLADGSYQMTVQDSNFHNNGQVDIHQLNSKQISGYIPSEMKPEYQTGSGVDTATALKDFAAGSAVATPQQRADAIAAGYKTEPEIKGYAMMANAGVTPPSAPSKPLTTTDISNIQNRIQTDPDVSAYHNAKVAQTEVGVFADAIKNGTYNAAVDDQSLANLYEKTTNQGAIVRDQAVARLVGGQDLVNSIGSIVGKAASGGIGLSNEQRQGMINIISKVAGALQPAYVKAVGGIADAYSLCRRNTRPDRGPCT